MKLWKATLCTRFDRETTPCHTFRFDTPDEINPSSLLSQPHVTNFLILFAIRRISRHINPTQTRTGALMPKYIFPPHTHTLAPLRFAAPLTPPLPHHTLPGVPSFSCPRSSHLVPGPRRRPFPPVARGTLGDSLPGFTPWMYVNYDDSTLEHDFSVDLEGISSDHVYDALVARAYLNNCLPDLVDETLVYEEDADVCDVRMYYRWGTLPALEIMYTERHYDKDPGNGLKFVALVGLPLVGSFDLSALPSGDGGTRLKVHLKYQVPELLKTHVGGLPIWGDVEKRLESGLARFKEQLERKTK